MNIEKQKESLFIKAVVAFYMGLGMILVLLIAATKW